MSRDPSIPGLQHIPSIPYKENATRLQTLDIWLPPPPPASPKATWLIYVHGGAWRDPTQDSLCVIPTLRELIRSHPDLITKGHIAGIASINYRLSPYPTHDTHPSDPDDPDRNVTHPAHVLDVQAAVQYLVQEKGVERWIGVGHSCGATLLLQLHGHGVAHRLQGLVLLAGIYDIPLFLSSHMPPRCPAHIARIYANIVAGAFGSDPATYSAVSPVAAKALAGRYVVLAWSAGDMLVEREQRDGMLTRYLEEGWGQGDGGKGVVEGRDLEGGHDEVWEEGGQVAGLIAEVVRRLGA